MFDGLLQMPDFQNSVTIRSSLSSQIFQIYNIFNPTKIINHKQAMQLQNIKSRRVVIQSCSSSSTDSSKNQIKQFHTINSIYQLHSIINQLSIQKQKYFIAYTTVLQNGEQMEDEYENIINSLKRQIQKKDKEIGELKQKLEFEKENYRRKCKQRQEIGKLLDTVTDKNSNLTVYTIISDYPRLKSQLSSKTQQITNLTQQLTKKQQIIIQSSRHFNSLNTNLSQKLNQLTLHLKQQQQKHIIQKQMIIFQHDFQKQKLSKQFKQYKNGLLQQQKINRELYRKINEYQTKFKKVWFKDMERQSKQIQQVNNEYYIELTYKQLYMKLKQNYQNILQSVSQPHGPLKQLQHAIKILKQNCLVYQIKIQQKNKLISLLQQSNKKMNKIILQLQNLPTNLSSPRQSNTNYMIILQQFKIQHEQNIKKLQKIILEYKVNVVNLQNKVEQKQRQNKILKQRLKIQWAHLQNIQSKHQQLNSKNINLQSQLFKAKIQNNSRSIKLQHLTQKILNVQQQLYQKQQILKSLNKQQKCVKLTVQNYQKILSKQIQTQKVKQSYQKQNIRFRKQLNQLQRQMIEKIQKFNQMEKQAIQNGKTLGKKQAQLAYCKNKIQKLNKDNQVIQRQYDRQRQQLLNKIKQLQQITNIITQQNQQYQQLAKIIKKRPNKSRQIKYDKKTIDINIFPIQKQRKFIIENNETPQKSISNQKSIKSQSSFMNYIKNKTEVTKRINQVLSTRDSSQQYVHLLNLNHKTILNNTSNHLKSQQETQLKNKGTANFTTIKTQKQKIKNQQNLKIIQQHTEDEKINSLIRQLKKQNRQLSQPKLISF